MTENSRPAAVGNATVGVDLRALEPGTHLIFLYRSAAELARTAAAFVAAGLQAGDRVVYLAENRPLRAVRAVLAAGDASAAAAAGTGQLSVLRFSEVYGAADGHDPAAVAAGFRSVVVRTRAEGFPGLRIAAEMSGDNRSHGPIERMLAWERLTTRLQQEEGVTSVCQYDRQRINREHRRLLAAEHAGSAPGWVAPPRASFLATAQGLRITGELDQSNRDECMRVVEARLKVVPRLVLDLGGLSFVDVGTLRRWYAVAAGLPPGGHLTLARPAPELVRLIELLAWRHPRLTVDPPGTGVAQ